MSGLAGAPRRAAHEDDEGGGFDPRLVRDLGSYVVRAVRVRWGLVLAIVLAGVVASAALLAVVPRKYHAETRILAQKNQVIAALGNPNRPFGGDSDAPTRAASETVKSQDNVLSLIRQTGLVDHWVRTRSGPMRLKDKVFGLLRGQPSREDIEDALASLLKRRIFVWTGPEGSVTITIDWPDPEMAYRVVEAAQENFLEARHVAEISVIADSIALLEAHAITVRQGVDVALEDYRQRRSSARRVDAASAAASAAASRLPEDPELSRLSGVITTKRRAVKDLEDFRQRRLSELQSQLAEQRAVYADSHPLVVNLRESIDALSKDSPNLSVARRELHELEVEYERKAGQPFGGDGEAARLAPVEPLKVSVEAAGSKVEPGEEYARQRLNAAVARYNTLLERIDIARMELEAARAAFKYRYVVTQPPRRPKKPSSPNVAMLFTAGVLASLGAAVLAAVVAEFRRGLVVQAWQVERGLGLTVLAEAQHSK